MNAVISRLRDAMNAHDPKAMAELFSPGYRSEQPLHPQRGFGGRDQVVSNWTQMFEGVPNLEAGGGKGTNARHTPWSGRGGGGAPPAGVPVLRRGGLPRV